MRGLSSLHFTLIASLLAALPLPAQDGKTLFAQHCAACHLPDRQLVGPSMVEVSRLYSTKLEEFLTWCKMPVQKRKGVIQMPPMAHVGDANLALIHAYVIQASKGVKEIKVKGLDPFYASPSMRKRPQVQRIFMPEAGPAAIAVAVTDELHYCWDAGECRLRYIWKGDFIDGWTVWRGNGNGFAKIQGEVLLREKKSPLIIPASSDSPRFLGYSLKDGLPTFRWRVGKVEVMERISPTANGKALHRSFDVTGSPSVSLKPQESDQMKVFSGASSRTSASDRVHATMTMTPKP